MRGIESSSAGPGAVVRPVVVHLTTIDVSLDLLLLPQLRTLVHRGYVVIGMSAPGPHVARLEAEGISHVALPLATRAIAPWRDLRTVLAIAKALRRIRPAILHTHTPKMGILGRVVGRVLRVPVVVNTVHGLWYPSSGGRVTTGLALRLERLAAACSDAELVQNPEDLQTMAHLGVPSERLHLLGNGVDLSDFDGDVDVDARAEIRERIGASESDVVVGFVGRLVEEKGLSELLHVARRLTDEPVKFVLVGPEDPVKRDAVDPRSIPANVFVAGFQSDLHPWYSAFDMVVLPSHREGMPRSLMEAAAMGLPAVTTDVRGCRQVVRDGVTGVVVPPKDPVALERAIVSLAADAPRRRAMGKAARRVACEEFDVSRQVEISCQVYAAQLRDRGLATP